MAEFDAFVFLPEVAPDFISKFAEQGLPPGIRYAASCTGPWQGLAIAEFDTYAELPSIVNTLANDPPTAVGIRPTYTKKSDFHPYSAFVRIHVGDEGPRSVLEAVRGAIGSKEADLVLGDFDIVAYVGADTEEELTDTILYRVARISGIRKTVTCHVIDYRSTSQKADDQHRVGTKGPQQQA
jgi:DNA-binding Lrp family transcriptional regulator